MEFWCCRTLTMNPDHMIYNALTKCQDILKTAQTITKLAKNCLMSDHNFRHCKLNIFEYVHYSINF